jgi:hypothetical protein
MTWFIVLMLVVILGMSSCNDGQRIAQLEQQNEELRQRILEHNSQAQELYDFATKALEYWEVIQKEYVNTQTFLFTIKETPSHDAGIEIAQIETRLLKTGDRIKLLYAPPDALKIKSSLLEEHALVIDVVRKAIGAWSSLDKGNQSDYNYFYREAVQLFIKYQSIYKKVELDLINLRLQAEHDLKL